MTPGISERFGEAATATNPGTIKAFALKVGDERGGDEGADDDLAREKEHFGKTTDSSAYLKNREEQLKASVEASYLHQRDTMLELLLAWMGDVVRHKVNAEHFDVPEQIESTRALADKLSIEEASRRVKVLNKLEQHLHTNVSENLALEVCFIEAFGS